MKIGKTLYLIFCNSGYEEPIYDNYKTELRLQNGRMVQTTSFIGSIIMSLLTLAALVVPSVSKVLPLYLTTAIIFIGIYILSKMVGEKNSAVTLLCNYAFLSAAFFFAIGLDVIQKNPTATTICVLLVALPLLIVDRPYREGLYFLAVSICFMIETVFIKQSPKASIDVLNAVSFYGVGVFLGYKHNQMVLRNLKGHSLLEVQRDTDTLTGLLNKGAIETKADSFLEFPGVTAGLMIIDMDNFKHINDTYGHHSGDEILIKVGQLLKSSFGEQDLVSRFGGDEFIVFLPMNHDRKEIREKAEQILDGVEAIRIDADPDYRAHICMGIAMYPEDGNGYDKLFRSADEAMYRVKKNGKNGFGFYGEYAKKKVLVVDDIEINRAILKKTLDVEYEALEAEDGTQALEILKEYPEIALVITDIQMPNMDGIELIRQIRGNAQFAHVAIIANTQYGDRKQENEIIQMGVDEFVYKAASPKVIQMRVKNVMKGR